MGTPGQRLRAARESAGFSSAKEAAEAMGLPVPSYIQHENGTRGIPPAKAAKYASFFRTTPEMILYGRGDGVRSAPAPFLTDLPLLSDIRAGAWLEEDDVAQHEPEIVPVTIDRRYPHARQWLRTVVGDSMDAAQIFEGNLAHLVDYVAAGVQLRTGHIVEVTRYRAGGSLREVSLKQVEVTKDGILLWPRSTNPAWKEPLVLDDGSGQDIEVQITGLLLNAFRRFE